MSDVTQGKLGARGERLHPGSGRRKGAAFPKGRVLKPDELAALRALLGERPRARELLIEYLHLIQDAEGCLPEGQLHALAEELKLPMAEVYEVATFYAHFDVVADGEPRPEPTTVRICDSLSCMLAGAEALLAALQSRPLSGIRVLNAPCMGACQAAPVAHVGHRRVEHATAERLVALA